MSLLSRKGRRGNCYAVSEAAYHLLGGKRAGWKPMYLKWGNHWFLKHKSGMILDLSRKQFGNRHVPYEKARGCGFLTKGPSKRARVLMDRMVWFDGL